jgi:hypothetical protein
MPPPTSETRERARVVVVLRVLCAVARTIARRISRVTKREDAYVSSFFAEFVLLLFPFYLFYICFSLFQNVSLLVSVVACLPRLIRTGRLIEQV